MTNSTLTNDTLAPFPPPYCEGNTQFYFLSTVQLFSQLEVPGWLGLGSKALKLKLPTLAQEGLAGDDRSVGKYHHFSVHSLYLDDNPKLFAQALAAIEALGPVQLSTTFASNLDLSGHIVCVIKDARADPDVGAFYVEFNAMDLQDISGALAQVSRARINQTDGSMMFVDEDEEEDPLTALFGEACVLQGNQLILDIQEYELIAGKDEWGDVDYRLELDRHAFLNALERVLLRTDHQLKQLSKAWASVTKID